MRNPASFLRHVALAEAVSYLVLLGIAMPLKYVWGEPLAVRIVGAVHGGLFVLLVFALLQVLRLARWPLSRAAAVFLASLVPFVPFFMDARLRQWADEFEVTKPE